MCVLCYEGGSIPCDLGQDQSGNSVGGVRGGVRSAGSVLCCGYDLAASL